MDATLNRDETLTLSSSRTSAVSETNIQLPFEIMDETSKTFFKFQATGRNLLIKFNNPDEKQEPTKYLKECITTLTNYLVKEVADRDLVGLRIRNTENLQDMIIGISLRRRDQLKPDVVWYVLGKVIQSNARFPLTDRLDVHLDHVRMPAGNGREKTKGRSLDKLSATKRSIVTVKAAVLCLTNELIIAIARVNNDPKYALYRHGYGLRQPVKDLLKASGVDLSNGGGLEKLQYFQQYFSDYKIIVFDGLHPDRVMFSGNSLSEKKLYLLCDRESGHYSVITNLKGAMAKTYMCNDGDTLYDKTHKCDKVCSLCSATPPCTKDQVKNCGTCNRYCFSEKCFQNHVTLNVKGKLVCQWTEVCRNCSYLVTSDSKHDCFKKFCTFCNNLQAIFVT
jgi:hypothetical protein